MSSDELERLKDQFYQLYEIEFPDSLFYFNEFFVNHLMKETVEVQDTVGMGRTGVLDILDRLITGRAVVAERPLLLHWRFYRDPPEFFTCLHGHIDGLHWGLLWDEPSKGFRGAASYYNNDDDIIEVYGGLFDALMKHLDDGIESDEENLEYDPDNASYYIRGIEATKRIQTDLTAYVDRHGISMDEGRGSGVDSDTGLDLIVPPKYINGGRTYGSGCIRKDSPDPETIGELLKTCDAGDPIPAMITGRSLWYWGGKDNSQAAHQLLRAGYEKLNRKRFITILDLHYHNRNMASVDLFAR